MPHVPNREAILIHAGNDAQKDLRGCIAPVTRCTGSGTGVYSGVALDRLKALVYPVIEFGEPVWLVVTEGRPTVASGGLAP